MEVSRLLLYAAIATSVTVIVVSVVSGLLKAMVPVLVGAVVSFHTFLIASASVIVMVAVAEDLCRTGLIAWAVRRHGVDPVRLPVAVGVLFGSVELVARLPADLHAAALPLAGEQRLLALTSVILLVPLKIVGQVLLADVEFGAIMAKRYTLFAGAILLHGVANSGMGLIRIEGLRAARVSPAAWFSLPYLLTLAVCVVFVATLYVSRRGRATTEALA